jgi:hypothetical protein
LAGSEALLSDLVGDHLLDALNISDLLTFQVVPEVLQLLLAIGIGDVLVVSPQGIEPLAQFVNQIVIVIGTTTSFSDVFHFLFGCEDHDKAPLILLLTPPGCDKPSEVWWVCRTGWIFVM